jgi:hypothetical protein
MRSAYKQPNASAGLMRSTSNVWPHWLFEIPTTCALI